MAKKNRKPIAYICDIYKAHYYFCVNWPRSDFKAYIKNVLSHEKDLDGISGCCLSIESPYGYVIWTDTTDKRYKNKALMHECIHAACFTLDRRGVNHDWPVCEPLTYLAENLFFQALGGFK